MVKALFDTNILIDHLNGVPEARDEFGRYDGKAISIITWLDVMVGAAPEVEAATRAFLNAFEIVALDGRIAESAVALRKANRIKLPDAIIWAWARERAMFMVTRNAKDFPAGDAGVRMPHVV